MRCRFVAGTLAALALTFAHGDAGMCSRCRSESALVLALISPGGVLTLGDDLAISYRIVPGTRFQSVKLCVTNNRGELVYLDANLPATAGNHRAIWAKGKWNQQPHVGALANPRNGPYAVALVAEGLEGTATTSITYSFPRETRLVLQCDLTHDKPSKDEISSGLSRAMLDLKSPERLRIGLVRQGAKVTETAYAIASPVFSDIVEEDLDNDPTELEVKSVHVRQVMQSTFADGIYNVVLTNARTGAGQPLPEDGIVDTWTVNLR
jgi:hypothetical protein